MRLTTKDLKDSLVRLTPSNEELAGGEEKTAVAGGGVGTDVAGGDEATAVAGGGKAAAVVCATGPGDLFLLQAGGGGQGQQASHVTFPPLTLYFPTAL